MKTFCRFGWHIGWPRCACYVAKVEAFFAAGRAGQK